MSDTEFPPELQDMIELRDRLDAAAAARTPEQIEAARRARAASVPFDFMAMAPTEQLLFLLDRSRTTGFTINSIIAPLTPGCEGWFSDMDGALVEEKRKRLLAELERTWRSGRFASNFAGDLYALALLLSGKDRYATVAERETAYFLGYIAHHTKQPLISLRELKDVNANGFDGLFIGSLPALGVGGSSDRFVGLEVKTVVDRDSLSGRISTMLKAWGTRQTYRRKNLESAKAEIKKQRGANSPEYARIVDATPANVATLLVVRSCTMNDRFTLPARSTELFDRIVTMNIFGQAIPEACHGVTLRPRRPGELSLLTSIDSYNRWRINSFYNAIVTAGATDPRLKPRR